MKEFIYHNRFWLFAIIFAIVPSAVVLPPVVTQVLYLLILLIFTLKNQVASFLIVYVLLLMFSDSRQEMFAFSQQIKPVGALLLPVLVWINKREGVYHPFVIYLIPFLLIAIGHLFLAPDFFLSFQKTLSYVLTVICIPILVYKECRNDKENLFLKGIMMMFIIYLLISTGLRFLKPDFVYLKGRFSGLMGNPNGYGILLVVTFALYQAIREKDRTILSRWWRFVYFPLLILGLFWCSSRAAMMAVILFYGYALVYSFSWILGWLGFIVSMIFYGEILELIPLVTNYLGFGENLRTESVSKIKEGSGRMIAWEFAWKEIKEHVVFGRGIAFTEKFFREHYWELAFKGHQGNAHNTYLTVWLDTGLIGLLSFLYAILGAFIKLGGKLVFAVPVLFSVLFSINYESWLSGSLNPFTPIFLITLTVFYVVFQDVKDAEKSEGKITTENDVVDVEAQVVA